MIVVGLTGGIGSGKSEVARQFAALGVTVVDTDVIAHALTAPGQPVLRQIAETFGPDMLKADGSLDRGRLRRRVFADENARKSLEGMLHPLIRKGVEAELSRHAEVPYAVVVVPLLFETGGYADMVARRLVVDCDEALQVARTMARSQLTEAEVRAVMAAQCTRSQRLELADDVLDNSGSKEMLAEQVRRLHEKYSKTCMVKQSLS